MLYLQVNLSNPLCCIYSIGYAVDTAQGSDNYTEDEAIKMTQLWHHNRHAREDRCTATFGRHSHEIRCSLLVHPTGDHFARATLGSWPNRATTTEQAA